ncbi:hypothetical protein L596_023071 [Steinernema carpocapsae]|uniref:Uncharacterized protein n=1 Tax=Steinernema carpocapsae TaxID=34508 RepID=A0A4U5MCI6_STECR|nr:hypothetical protein L596_023071 [Steinernema carpocapsae]
MLPPWTYYTPRSRRLVLVVSGGRSEAGPDRQAPFTLIRSPLSHRAVGRFTWNFFRFSFGQLAMESTLIAVFSTAIFVFAVNLAATVTCGMKKRPPLKKSPAHASAVDLLQPAKPKLSEKEELIAKGKKRGKNDYPTMDDVVSDWSSEEEKEKNPKNAPKSKLMSSSQEQSSTTPKKEKSNDVPS